MLLKWSMRPRVRALGHSFQNSFDRWICSPHHMHSMDAGFCYSHPWALQKRLDHKWAGLAADSCAPKKYALSGNAHWRHSGHLTNTTNRSVWRRRCGLSLPLLQQLAWISSEKCRSIQSVARNEYPSCPPPPAPPLTIRQTLNSISVASCGLSERRHSLLRHDFFFILFFSSSRVQIASLEDCHQNIGCGLCCE